MNLLYYILWFILGSIMGSFYHVVGTRLSEDKSLLNPKRSFCPACGHVLSWYELVPIISYLIQIGKCRKCKKNIPILYLFVEVVSGCLFTLSFYSFGMSLELIIALALVSLFVIVIVSDFNYMIIPDQVTITISIIIALSNFFIYGIHDGLLRLASGTILFVFMYSLMLLGNYLFKTESLGGGDIKLMFPIGLVLNPILGMLVIFLSSFIALPVSLILYLINKEKMIPFGPFIMVAVLLILFMKIDLDNLYHFLKMLTIRF